VMIMVSHPAAALLTVQHFQICRSGYAPTIERRRGFTPYPNPAWTAGSMHSHYRSAISQSNSRFWTILDSIYARARVNVNLELSRSGNGVRNGFRRPDGRGSGQFAESALDTLYVARNRGWWCGVRPPLLVIAQLGKRVASTRADRHRSFL